MQQKPDGDRSRQPTDYWAGYGFSKSMPGAQIKEMRKNHNIRQDPLPHTHYEVEYNYRFDLVT